MNSVAEKEDFVSTFVKRLRDLDDGERARFKRNAGTSMDESHNALGLFYKRLLFDYSLRERDEDVYFLIATLFPFEKKPKQTPESSATEPSERPKNFGASLGKIRHRIEGKKEGAAKGLDNRFERLLDADEQQLSYYLRHEAHFLMNQEGGRIHWEQLLRDLLIWDYADRRVQRRWARDYFASPAQEQPTDNQ